MILLKLFTSKNVVIISVTFVIKTGHLKKNCLKFKVWFEKKSKSCVLVCFELNFIEVCHNTRWINFGSTTHISNIMQRFLIIQTTKSNENFVFMRNGNKVLKVLKLII